MDVDMEYYRGVTSWYSGFYTKKRTNLARIEASDSAATSSSPITPYVEDLITELNVRSF